MAPSFRKATAAIRRANVLQTFWAVAANVLQTPDRRNPAKPGEKTHAIPRVFGVSSLCSLRFAEHEPIGETGSLWLSHVVFGASAVFLRSQRHDASGTPASRGRSRIAAQLKPVSPQNGPRPVESPSGRHALAPISQPSSQATRAEEDRPVDGEPIIHRQRISEHVSNARPSWQHRSRRVSGEHPRPPQSEEPSRHGPPCSLPEGEKVGG
jgi:hypothetical protein